MGSIPVRVTIMHSRKQRRYVVSEFFFYSENRVCPLLVRYSDIFNGQSFFTFLNYTILKHIARLVRLLSS